MLISVFWLFLIQADWRAQFNGGKQGYARQAYVEAVTQLSGALADADDATMTETSRLLAAVHREMGDPAQAERVLMTEAARCLKRDPNDVRLAPIMEDIAAIKRSRSQLEKAMSSMETAVHIREQHSESPRIEVARDYTSLAMMRYEVQGAEGALTALERAVREWDTAAPGDLQSLVAIEALATAYREVKNCAGAEPLLRRALRLREAVSGPEGAEVISSVDSLAYVEFGLEKMDEAETLYKRLLALWVKNAGPEHPMVALALDKMAEAYTHQQRYEDAQKCTDQALALRAKVHLASLRQSGQLLVLQGKTSE